MSTFHALLESDVPVFSGIVDTKVATSRVQMSSVTDEASDPTPTALATQEYKACEGDVTLVAADRHLPQRIKHTPHPKYGPRNDEMVIIVIGEVSFEISKRRLETESQWFKNRFASAPDEVNPTIYNVVGLVPAVTPAHFALLLDLMNCFPSWDFSDYTHSDIYGICTASKSLEFHVSHRWALLIIESRWFWRPNSLLLKHGLLPNHGLPKIAWAILLFSHLHDIPSIRPHAILEIVRHRDYWVHCEANPDYPVQIYTLSVNCLAAARQKFTEAWERKAIIVDLPPCDAPSHPGSAFADVYASIMHRKEGGLFKKYQWNPLEGLQALIDTDWNRDAKTCCSACVERMKSIWRADLESVTGKTF